MSEHYCILVFYFSLINYFRLQEVSKRTTAQRIYLSQLKQQAIQDKLKKSMPPKTNDNENYASSFCPPPKLLNQQQLQQQQKQSELSWPSSGSMVRVQLDADTVITGRVSADGRPADALRSTGYIGIETTDGDSIEVPYPNENVTVIDQEESLDVRTSSIIGNASSGSSSTINSVEDTSKSIKTNLNSFDVNGLRSQSDDVISMSAWPSDMNKSEWLDRGQTLIGKRLSRNTGKNNGFEDPDLIDGDDLLIDQADEYDNDNEVQWVDGHENLRVKKKRKNREDDNGDNDDYSDDDSEEDFHWQTPNDSAEIDIEVLLIIMIMAGAITFDINGK